ncbi:phage virion morphogenesis protein [Herbaspirillum sp. ST 5-3]|uniref:phage virion morphogenesis protein n=1 Tax=Oxalobacteraceae TaxID=75682 RepID=UPI0014560BF7|nr:phage virion morphogenesis protein [Herbaspirillum sp. ST 5-3]
MNKVIQVDNQEVKEALAKLRGRMEDMSPVLMAIGEDIIERIKMRFSSGVGPDGARWKPNAPSTLMRYIQSRGGFSKKTGKITSKGQQLAMGKRPLQGETGDLARQFSSVVVGGTSLLVSSTMIYAAMQHFGGTKAQFPNLWGDIPARPFFPITASGELYPNEAEAIVDRIRQYLED